MSSAPSHRANSKIKGLLKPEAKTGSSPQRQKEVSVQGMLQNKKLSEAQTHIKNILVNGILYEESPLDDSIFKSDLVLKLRVPSETYKKRSSKTELGSIVRKFPKSLYRAYEAAYDDLYASMEQMGDEVQRDKNIDKELRIRQFAAFVKHSRHTQKNAPGAQNDEKSYKEKKVYFEEREQLIQLNCSEEATGLLDSFTISYNTLIYTMQQFCGFKVRSFMVSSNSQAKAPEGKIKKDLRTIQTQNKGVERYIYILLYLPSHNMIKAANKYHIKKQVDYVQVDPFLNDPMDSANRPIRYNSEVRSHLFPKKEGSQDGKEKAKAQGWWGENQKKIDNSGRKQKSANQDLKETIKMQKETEQRSNRKTMDRKIGLVLPDHLKGATILNEVKMSRSQVENYLEFNRELEEELQNLIGLEKNRNYFNDPQNEDKLTPQEKRYLLAINRGKLNPGVEKKYVQLKKKRKYFQILQRLAQRYGYGVYETPPLYAEFKLASKSKKFFSRLEQVLLYKETVSSPSGELVLFNKMERIKLTYLVLKQYLRVENSYMLECTVYALNDEYEKFNKVGKKNSGRFHYHYEEEDSEKVESIKGGLNGKNLETSWKQFLVWRTDFTVIRNYLGQSKAFEILIKTQLIQLFMLLAPVGVVCQVIKLSVIAPNASNTAYFPEFWFYMAYMLLVTVIYGVFVQKYRRVESNFIQNFVEDSPAVDFINEYRGPYMRDNSNDNANTYDEKFVAWRDRLKTYSTFLLVFIILGAEIGFYYGIRAAIVDISYKIPEYGVFSLGYFRPIHLIGYSIYFCFNAVFYNFFLVDFVNYLTGFENKPTKQAYVSSENLKLYIVAVGIEMIGPIDLVYIQYSAKTSCSADWCANELEAYIYCRYIIILFFTILSALNMFRKFIQKKVFNSTHDSQPHGEIDFSRKLALFLQFVYQESIKEKCADLKLVDETVALIQFATFLTVFPFGPAISFFSMLADYMIERQEILRNQQRPIPKSEKFQAYRKVIVGIGHWMLFFNFSQMFIVLEWLEYLFPDLVLAISNPPSLYSIMTIKYISILVLMLFFEIVMRVTVKIVSRRHSIMDRRKWNMLQKHSLKILNTGGSIVLKKPKPIHSISRTFNSIRKIETEKQTQHMASSRKVNAPQQAQVEALRR